MQGLIDIFKPERTFRPQKKFGKGTSDDFFFRNCQYHKTDPHCIFRQSARVAFQKGPGYPRFGNMYDRHGGGARRGGPERVGGRSRCRFLQQNFAHLRDTI